MKDHPLLLNDKSTNFKISSFSDILLLTGFIISNELILCDFLTMSKQSKAALRYLRHRINVRSKYDLHSPFAYRVYSDILKDETIYPEFRSIEKMRSRLLKDPGYLKMSDLGAGAGE